MFENLEMQYPDLSREEKSNWKISHFCILLSAFIAVMLLAWSETRKLMLVCSSLFLCMKFSSPLKSELGDMQPCSELKSSTAPQMRCAGVDMLRSHVRIWPPFSMCMQMSYLNFWGQYLSLLITPVSYQILYVCLFALPNTLMYVIFSLAVFFQSR